ncbi:MAG: four helix bundle protein [Pirellulales bacterium]|nr:four helix bundle protein [Pirellulales bacterium]
MEKRNKATTKNFRDLRIWSLGKVIALNTYRITKNFPREEAYGMTSQMRRAALSIPSNIAEGFNRNHNNEYRQFLFIALGSCAELETQAELCLDLKYISKSDHSQITEKINHESRMLRSLINKLNKARKT